MASLNRKLLYLAIPIVILGGAAYFWKSGSDSFDSHLTLGMKDLDLKLYSQAESHFRKASSLMPSSGKAYYWLGMSLRAQSKNEEALEAFNKALSLADPNDFFLHSNLAPAFYNLKNYSAAEKEYRLALTLNPDDVSLNSRLAFLIQEKGGDQAEALKLAQRVTEIQPNSPVSWASLAAIYSYYSRFDEALRAANRALQIDPASCLAIGSKVDVLVLSQKYGEVLEIANKLINSTSVKPDCLVVAYYAKGRYFESKKLIPEAIAAYEQVISVAGSQVDRFSEIAQKKARDRIEALKNNK